MSLGRVFEIKRFAVHDGHGIRTTFFFKGCPLYCIWCHNPEGLSQEPEIALLERKCVKCSECVTSCMNGLHIIDNDAVHLITREGCTFCLDCVNACMADALKLYGKEYTVNELCKIAASDIDFYNQSGGGITCSGGEPLMQADFLEDFLSLCKEKALHTAVDTSGHASWLDFEKILPFTDIFYYDIKHMEPARHKELTGMDNNLILENLQKLSETGAAVEVRIPVIPGLNDDEENIQQTADFLKSIKTLKIVRPLPYHALSMSKYTSIGKNHTMPAATGKEYEAARHVCDIISKNGLKCKKPD